MKTRKVFLLILALGVVVACQAQGQNDRWKKKYVNLGFVNTTMSVGEKQKLFSNYGISFTSGRTFYLHKRPLNKTIRFGIDATWLDLNYANYAIEHITNQGIRNYQYHQGEVSMQIGPSVVISPSKKCNIHCYIRYAPSMSVLYDDESYYGNYATFFVGGASLSYGMIGLGVESRIGYCEYKKYGDDVNKLAYSFDKTFYSGLKTYLTFKF